MSMKFIVAALLSGFATAGLAQTAQFNASYTLTLAVDPAKAQPQSQSDRALIKAAGALGTVEVGTLSDTGIWDGSKLRLRSLGTGTATLKTFIADERLDMARTSEAELRNGLLVTTRYTDRRGSSPLLVYAADLRKGQYELRRGGKVVATDKLRQPTSDLAALPYLFIGRTPPKSPITLAYTDGKALREVSFKPVAENLTVAGGSVATTRLTSAPKTRDDPTIEIWLRNEDGFPLRVRVGLGSKYGVVADQQIKTLPPLVKGN
jgi:hypothetical protein